MFYLVYRWHWDLKGLDRPFPFLACPCSQFSTVEISWTAQPKCASNVGTNKSQSWSQILRRHCHLNNTLQLRSIGFEAATHTIKIDFVASLNLWGPVFCQSKTALFQSSLFDLWKRIQSSMYPIELYRHSCDQLNHFHS